MEKDSNGSTGVARSNAPSTEPPAADDVFDALADERRRLVLWCLQTYETPMELIEIAEEIVVLETGTEEADGPDVDLETVHTSLYHVHVPKLADAGIVEYDRDRDVVTLLESVERHESVLDPFAE